MCQDIQQVTFFCGHQIKFWYGKSRFCLFTGKATSRFHTTYLFFDRNEEKCAWCQIVQHFKEEGESLKPSEFRQIVKDRYAETQDSLQEQEAKKWESLSEKAHSELTAERVADLENQIKVRIAFHLSKVNCTPGSKVILLRTLTRLPEIFNRQELVRFFASRYFSEGDKRGRLQGWERKQLFSIAHQARLERTFKAGLNLQEPLPLPTRPSGGNPALAIQEQQEKIEEGLAKMAVSS
ncbi:hypothetical protein F4859DRAFT_519689 [Xylaria cf. heliscus]|nr:hypothetical protein F4859DRAFT_519689 [Xylaria cf. heliscus]